MIDGGDSLDRRDGEGRQALRGDDGAGAAAALRASADGATLAARIGGRARRKLRAQRRGAPVVWSGLGVMGMVGWSIVVPTLLGALLGGWLDRRHLGGHSWTLALLVAGLVVGCFNAGFWVMKEQQAMHREEVDGDD